jgi:hypothetical protein
LCEGCFLDPHAHRRQLRAEESRRVTRRHQERILAKLTGRTESPEGEQADPTTQPVQEAERDAEFGCVQEVRRGTRPRPFVMRDLDPELTRERLRFVLERSDAGYSSAKISGQISDAPAASTVRGWIIEARKMRDRGEL